MLSSHLKTYYISQRFITDDSQWPPEQPRHFTPVVMVHQDNRRSKKDSTDSSLIQGSIDQYISSISRKCTKNLHEVLLQLEQPSSCGRPHLFLIEGSPGIGKSILLKHIAYLWAKNELLPMTNFLFLLHLRDPAVQQINCVNSLVHHFYKYEKEAQKIANSCTTFLMKDGGKSVAILLDGYDEFPEDLRKKSFISDLINHVVLPASAVVITSRPHASTRLCNNVTCRIEILGFSEEDQAHFIHQSLEGEDEKLLQLNQYLKDHPTIMGLCFVPFNMTVLLLLYEQQVSLPTNSAELFNLFICLTICRHLNKTQIPLEEDITDLHNLPNPYSSVIRQLSKFAFKALCKTKLVFSLDEIKECCPSIGEYPNCFGLLQAVEYVRLISKTRSFNFIHLSVQEYLAAYYVARLPQDDSEELSILQEYFWSDTHYNMFNYYVSLTQGQSPSFKSFLKSFNSKIANDYTFRRRNILKFIRLFHCFYDAGDSQMCQAIEQRFSDRIIDLYGRTLTANDLQDIATVLTSSSFKQWKWISFGDCHIQDYGIRLLHRSLNNSGVSIDELYFFNNDLTSTSDPLLRDIALSCNVKGLNITSNKTVGGSENFTLLSNPSCLVESLAMYDNTYSSSQWASQLFNSLIENKSLQKLWSGLNHVTDEVCSVISTAIRTNNTLQELNMDGNPFTGKAFEDFGNSLKENNALQVLALSRHSQIVSNELKMLQDDVNKSRQSRGCTVMLEIKPGW